ncbi:MAG: single-stranded DNA-binding protein [Lentisphaeria bacterium]
MANLNKVMLMGNLTRDPLIKATASGLVICEFGLATNRHYKTAQGEDREEVCFIDLEAFGKTAELCGRFLHRGAPAYIEGRLKLDQWVDKTSGQNRSKLRVMVETVQFLERRPDAAGNPQAVSYDGQGNAMPPPPMMLPPSAYNPPPMQRTPSPMPAVQEATDGPPLSDYDEEANDMDVQF